MKNKIEEVKRLLANEQVFIRAYYPAKEALKYQDELALQICRLFEPDTTYTLTCDRCGKWFYSSVAFPYSPQLCPGCFESKPVQEGIDKTVVTDLKIIIPSGDLNDYFTFSDKPHEKKT